LLIVYECEKAREAIVAGNRKGKLRKNRLASEKRS
jgi:hypothetical protein